MFNNCFNQLYRIQKEHRTISDRLKIDLLMAQERDNMASDSEDSEDD